MFTISPSTLDSPLSIPHIPFHSSILSFECRRLSHPCCPHTRCHAPNNDSVYFNVSVTTPPLSASLCGLSPVVLPPCLSLSLFPTYTHSILVLYRPAVHIKPRPRPCQRQAIMAHFSPSYPCVLVLSPNCLMTN